MSAFVTPWPRGYLQVADHSVHVRLTAVPIATDLHPPRLRRSRRRRQFGQLLPALDEAGRWDVTGAEPDDLQHDALAELSNDEKQGPAALELAVLAIYPLVRTQALKREVSRTGDKSPSAVLSGLLGSEHGLRQLHRAVMDGRSRTPTIRLVDPAGKFVEVISNDSLAESTPRQLTDDLLREVARGTKPDTAATSTTNTPSDPRQAFRVQFENLKNQIADLPRLIETAEALTLPDGTSVWRDLGAPKPIVQELTTLLTQVMLRLGLWGEAFATATPLPAEIEVFSSPSKIKAPTAPPATTDGVQGGLPPEFHWQRETNSRGSMTVDGVDGWEATVFDIGQHRGHRVVVRGPDGQEETFRTRGDARSREAGLLAGHLLRRAAFGVPLPHQAREVLADTPTAGVGDGADGLASL